MEGVYSTKFFNSVTHLEPKCRNCGSVVDYGVTTKFDDSRGKHICKTCDQAVD